MKKIFTISEFDAKNNRSTRNYRYFENKQDAIKIYRSIGFKLIDDDEYTTTLYSKEFGSFIYIHSVDLE